MVPRDPMRAAAHGRGVIPPIPARSLKLGTTAMQAASTSATEVPTQRSRRVRQRIFRERSKRNNVG